MMAYLEYLTLIKAKCISQLFYYHGDISQGQINLVTMKKTPDK